MSAFEVVALRLGSIYSLLMLNDAMAEKLANETGNETEGETRQVDGGTVTTVFGRGYRVHEANAGDRYLGRFRSFGGAAGAITVEAVRS